MDSPLWNFRHLFSLFIWNKYDIITLSHVGHRIWPWCWSDILFRHPHSQGVDFDTLYNAIFLPFSKTFSRSVNSVFILGEV